MKAKMETILKILEAVRYIPTVILVCGVVWGLVLWARGIFPVLLRIGNGLAKRKIALFAKGDNANSLKALLVQSGLFREKNIFIISKNEDMEHAEGSSIYLVCWNDFSNSIEQILSRKQSLCPMIVYAPPEGESIPKDQYANLSRVPYIIVTNFRGRLLNDIVTTMITTSHKERI